VELVTLTAPWTAFTGKYRLHRWPWRELARTLRGLRGRAFDLGVSARRDPRDHVLLALARARRRHGFPHRGSGVFLTDAVPPPLQPHRAEHWKSLGASLGWPLPSLTAPPRPGRRIVIHPGAGQAVRIWPAERFAEIAARLRAAGWEVVFLRETDSSLDSLLDHLAGADRFIGNDSGPGHLAALLGVPTFTIFGPQRPELFAPQHPAAAWIEGAACPHKPCFDACRFDIPHCLHDVNVEAVWERLSRWLDIARGPA
jgi:ADP-heptose:LPS heptosyltransferase